MCPVENRPRLYADAWPAYKPYPLEAKLKILFSSYPFSPSVGGIETVSQLLAAEFVRRGHEVKLVTKTLQPDGIAYPFEVIRGPSAATRLSLARWSEIVFHNNISLQAAWPLIFFRRPWVITHATWIARLDGTLGWHDHLKRFLLRFSTNISVSRSIAENLPVSSIVISNPYRDDLFRRIDTAPRDIEIVYLGRLVSDKGVDLLIHALALLKEDGMTPRLTIAGAGPEEQALKALTIQLGLSEQIDFVGAQVGETLARLLNQHKIMAVPSRWAEPFGIVALEGIACGCVIVGSDAGGLPEAMGPCGLAFPNGNISMLAAQLRRLLTDADLMENRRTAAAKHLPHFTARQVAATYLELFNGLIQ